MGRCDIWVLIFNSGGTISVLELILAWALTFFYFGLSSTGDQFKWFWWNCILQMVLYVMVGVPAVMSGHMTYLEFVLRVGQVLNGIHGLIWGTGLIYRRILVCGFVCVYTTIWATIPLYLLFPWRFPDDLPRYQYVRSRFMHEVGSTEFLWKVKIAYDLFKVAWINAVVSGCPMMMVCFNNKGTPYGMEVFGIILAVVFWILELRAEKQRVLFLENKKESMSKHPVLGMPPYDGLDYSLWRRCRHPNLFAEWATLNSIVFVALPSLIEATLPGMVKVGFLFIYFFHLRLTYDMYVYWIGAEPTEYFQVKQHRSQYTKYQAKVRLFFPFELPRVNHGRLAFWPKRTNGWPYAPSKKKQFELQLPGDLRRDTGGASPLQTAYVSLPSVKTLDSDLVDI